MAKIEKKQADVKYTGNLYQFEFRVTKGTEVILKTVEVRASDEENAIMAAVTAAAEKGASIEYTGNFSIIKKGV